MSTFEVKRIDNILHGPKRNFEIDNRGMGGFLFSKFRENSAKTFQINAVNGSEESYDFVNKKCVRLALEMRRRGVKNGDVVLTCSSNNMESIVTLIGPLYLNAISVTLDPSISLRDTTHLLKLIRPKMIYVEEGSIDLIESALKGSSFQAEVIVIGTHGKYSTYAEFLGIKPEEDSFIPDIVDSLKNTAIIFFSSGTTGLPKATEISHYVLLYAIEAFLSLYPNYQDSIHFTSFYWMTGVLITLFVIRNGARKVVIKNFPPELYLSSVQKYKIKNIFMAPTLTYKITEDLVKKYPCPDLKIISLGGSAISKEQINKIRNYFPHCDVALLYAQTETGGLISSFPSFHPKEKLIEKPISSGLPVFNTLVKIVDIDTEKVLGPNEKGEIRVLTPTVCNGYYNQDSSNLLDGDGYVKTGDVGYYDDENYLYICDRIKDMFKYQSWHIVPMSLETVISEHPAVNQALVIGIPSEADGHIPMALVVLKDDASGVTENDLLNFANGKLTEREQLRGGLKIVKDFPKGTTGKVLRKHITDMVIAGQLQKLLE